MAISTFQRHAVKTALKKLLLGSYYDITTVKNICKVLNITPKAEVMSSLKLFHCIHYDEMEPEVREALTLQTLSLLDGTSIDVEFVENMIDNKLGALTLEQLD